jgi:hypothetical protein
MTERRPGSRHRPMTPDTWIGDHDSPERGDLMRTAGIPEQATRHSGRDTDTVPDQRFPSEADGVEDMRAFIGHTAWKSGPTVRIEVDEPADLLTMSFYRDHPDIEIDPSLALSVGFHRYRDEYLLTSLCLCGVGRWSQPPVPRAAAREDDVTIARILVGESASGAVAGLLGGGSGTVEVSAGEVAGLTPIWRRFVIRHTREQDRP